MADILNGGIRKRFDPAERSAGIPDTSATWTNELVLSEEDKIFIENLYICKGYSARQLISATRAGLSTACARCR